MHNFSSYFSFTCSVGSHCFVYAQKTNTTGFAYCVHIVPCGICNQIWLTGKHANLKQLCKTITLKKQGFVFQFLKAYDGMNTRE